MQICKELKAGFITAISHTHIGEVVMFYKETFVFFVSHALFSSIAQLHFHSAFPRWEWWYWSGGVGSSTTTFGSCPTEVCVVL